METLIALVVLFFATPFIEGMPGGKPIETLLWAVFLVSAVLAVGARRRTLLVAALLAVPTLVGHLLNRLHPQNFSAVLFLVGGLAFFAFVIVHFLRFVLRARRVTSEVLLRQRHGLPHVGDALGPGLSSGGDGQSGGVFFQYRPGGE